MVPLLPSKSGRNCFSPPWTRRKKPAMYAVPTARCSAEVRRVVVAEAAAAVPQTESVEADQSSDEGATETPGVHSVLKKLWSVPRTSRDERRTLSLCA